MSAHSTNHLSTPLLHSTGYLRRFFAAIGNGVAAVMLARQRMTEFRQLSAMTDTELAKRGITREGIASFVFRDQRI